MLCAGSRVPGGTAPATTPTWTVSTSGGSTRASATASTGTTGRYTWQISGKHAKEIVSSSRRFHSRTWYGAMERYQQIVVWLEGTWQLSRKIFTFRKSFQEYTSTVLLEGTFAYLVQLEDTYKGGYHRKVPVWFGKNIEPLEGKYRPKNINLYRIQSNFPSSLFRRLLPQKAGKRITAHLSAAWWTIVVGCREYYASVHYRVGWFWTFFLEFYAFACCL